MKSLAEMKCVPCQGGEPTVTEEEIAELKPKVPEWEIVEQADVKRLKRTFTFKDFVQALQFVNKIGELAEQQGHHPDVYLAWGKVRLMLWTHKIKGLHENDFILAAKADGLYTSPSK